jgi:hypothetical protein
MARLLVSAAGNCRAPASLPMALLTFSERSPEAKRYGAYLGLPVL